MAGMATSGALTRWFRDHLAKELIQLEQATGANSYAALAEEAGCTPPGADGLVVLPYFSGERTPINDPQAKGVIFGLTLAHTRGHLYRAILEGVGYGINHHFEVLTEIGAAPRVAVAVGGGTKNPLWRKLSAISPGRAGVAVTISLIWMRFWPDWALVFSPPSAQGGCESSGFIKPIEQT